jgi:hypothetical protein
MVIWYAQQYAGRRDGAVIAMGSAARYFSHVPIPTPTGDLCEDWPHAGGNASQASGTVDLIAGMLTTAQLDESSGSMFPSANVNDYTHLSPRVSRAIEATQISAPRP